MEYKLISPVDNTKTVIEQILINRGMLYEEIPHYLNAAKKDEYSPLLLDNIEEGARLLLKHLEEGHVHFQVDEDVDGFTSSAIVLNYLYFWKDSIINPNKITYSFHEGKAHGIRIADVPEGTTLVVAIDSSSSEFEIHKQLREKNMDVLILD